MMKINQKNLILNKYLDILNNYNCILIAHQHNLSSKSRMDLKNKYKNIQIQTIHNNIFVQALKSTKYKNLVDYIVGPNIIIYLDLKEVKYASDIFKSNESNLSLLFGLVEGEILQKNQFNLWQTLNSSSSAVSIIHVIQAYQLKLHHILKLNMSKIVFNLDKRNIKV